MKIKVDSLSALPVAAAEFLKALGSRRVVAFHAPMGAGKTTLVAELCRQLGVYDESASPTFSILNEYHGPDGTPVYHFDFYRLESPAEAFDIGAEDYFYSGAYCFVEWPDVVETILPADTAVARISVEPDSGARIIELD